MKLYIVVSSDLPKGLAIAQGTHAALLFAAMFPVLASYWFDEHNNLVVLQSEDLVTLANDLEVKGLRLARFFEPDLDNKLTAICVEPAGKKALRKLKLAA